MEIKYDGLYFKSDGPISGSFQTEGSETPLKITTDDMELTVHQVLYKIGKKFQGDTVVITQEELDKLINKGSLIVISKNETVSSNNSRLSEIE
jgi:hypothetical protein